MRYLNHGGKINWRKININQFFVEKATFYPQKLTNF